MKSGRTARRHPAGPAGRRKGNGRYEDRAQDHGEKGAEGVPAGVEALNERVPLVPDVAEVLEPRSEFLPPAQCRPDPVGPSRDLPLPSPRSQHASRYARASDLKMDTASGIDPMLTPYMHIVGCGKSGPLSTRCASAPARRHGPFGSRPSRAVSGQIFMRSSSLSSIENPHLRLRDLVRVAAMRLCSLHCAC